MPEVTSQASLPRRRLGRTGLELSVLGIGGWLGLREKSQAERRKFSAPEPVEKTLLIARIGGDFQ